MWYTEKLNIFSLLLTFSRTKRHPMIIFPDLPHVEVEGVEVAEEIILTLRTTSPTASCPSCGTASSRIQSRYTRTLRDLPSVGHPIRLVMQVRRFFCQKYTCAQKIFAERLPDLCRPHAQRTTRLQKALFFFQAEDGIRDLYVTGVQTCALPIYARHHRVPGLPQQIGDVDRGQ